MSKETLFAFMSTHDDPDAPDGAWWARLEDSVEMFNQDNNTSYEPFDMVHEYLQSSKD